MLAWAGLPDSVVTLALVIKRSAEPSRSCGKVRGARDRSQSPVPPRPPVPDL